MKLFELWWDLTGWFKTRIYLWQHRHDTPEQRHANLERAKKEFSLAVDEVKQGLSSEPATKELHEMFYSMDKMKHDLDID